MSPRCLGRIAIGLCLGVALCAPVALCVEPPAVEWTRNFGGSGESRGYSVLQTPDGDFVAAGFVRFNTHSDTVSFYLLKTDSDGNLDWERAIVPESRLAQAYALQQTADGGFVLAGKSTLQWRPCVVKTDSSGNLLWQNTFDMHQSPAFSVHQTRDGGYIVGGMSMGLNTEAGDSSGFWLLKTDADGSLEWKTVFLHDCPDFLEQVPSIQTSDGSYVLGGKADSCGLWLMKVDSAGQVLWQRTYLGQYVTQAYSIEETDDGGLAITGAGAASWLSLSGADVYLLKTDSLGNQEWRKTFGGAGVQRGTCVRQTSDRGYIVSGGTLYPHGQGMGAYIVRTDSLGNLLWTKTLAGYAYDTQSIQETDDGGYVAAGTVYDPVSGRQHLQLMKLGPDVMR
jgi:hypothetical protein